MSGIGTLSRRGIRIYQNYSQFVSLHALNCQCVGGAIRPKALGKLHLVKTTDSRHLSSYSRRDISTVFSRNSSLLGSPHLQLKRHLVGSKANLYANGNLTRQFSFGALPKFLGKAVRIPAAAGSAIVGGVAYVNYKVNEATSYTTDKLNQAADWASGVLGSARDAVDGFDLPDFSDWFARSASEEAKAASQKHQSDNSGSSGANSSGNSGGEDGGATAALAAAVGALGVDSQDSHADSSSDDQDIMLLTKKMIEIRGILQQVDQSDTLRLPSIVVVGSQSSGKSSVLEAIVGHEFLPKGSNMVTRRPIELTLINTPESASEYGEFPSLGLGKITDFSHIQKTLTDLNLAVSEADAVSDDPIQLNIYSRNVPDLTLIDLPGYIQVIGSDQPESLKQKINSLCEKYIQEPNIILAISSGDVDLANSSALKASRRVDPRGERTIGVITKMDLVDPNRAVQSLKNKNYPLQMGYVGVITRTPPGGLFRRSSNIGVVVAQNEQSYFSQHTEFEDHDCTVGTLELKKKLMHVLEKTMASSLQPTSDAIHQELEEATYQFKVEYNDRGLTAETYLAESVDAFKLAFKDLSSKLGRNEVRRLLKNELDQKVLDLLAQRYWNKPSTLSSSSTNIISPSFDPPLSDLPTSSLDDLYWHRKLEASTSSLTKLGVGRLSTTLVSNAITFEMERLINNTNFRNHPFAHDIIHDATMEILNSKYYSTADQVENCIKPYKYEVDAENREWATSREHSYNLLKEELRQCEVSYNVLKKNIGGHKLNQVISYVENSRSSTRNAVPLEGTEAFGFSQALLSKGREAVFLRDRADILRMRMAAIKSRQCKTKENKYYCPEVFLDVVADKLTQTAVLFLNVELLSDFYYNFPRELDRRLGKNLSQEQIEAFAKEDPKIKRQIELQQRKELLELALGKIEGVIALQKTRERGSKKSRN